MRPSPEASSALRLFNCEELWINDTVPFIWDIAGKYVIKLIEPRAIEGLFYLNKSFAEFHEARCFLQAVHLIQSLKNLILFKTEEKK